MKTKFFAICLFAGFFLWGCGEFPEYEITERPYVNKTALSMYIGDEAQLKSSPVGVAYTWSSDNETVASVTQTGKVTALSEGSAVITVASSNDKAVVEVAVKTFILLTDIGLSLQSLRIFTGDKAQISATPVPNNASEVRFQWRSANPEVATVDNKGTVTAIARGVTAVTVASGDMEKNVTVSVVELLKLSKAEWTVEVSDERADDGGGKDKIIDDDYGDTYWHSQWGPDAPLPHWAIIDMKEPQEVARIATLRRYNGDTRTLQYFVGDSPDPDGEWVKIAEGAYESRESSNHTLTLDVATPVTGRYLKLVLPDSFRDVYTAICEIDVYGLIY
ncbi:MAG: Ig-like domain-containing protein [Tannerella sp.]|jgi:hypothetical protein|nr:Ig-like domain-containing protein [Tannerella sp.]